MDAAITAVPPKHRRQLMITRDRAGASHGLIARINHQARRKPHRLIARAARVFSRPRDPISLISGNPEGADQGQ
jgi:hypothetical protein